MRDLIIKEKDLFIYPLIELDFCSYLLKSKTRSLLFPMYQILILKKTLNYSIYYVIDLKIRFVFNFKNY